MKFWSFLRTALTVVGALATLYLGFQAFLFFWNSSTAFGSSSFELRRFHAAKNEKATGVIIFVHGFTGDVEQTWAHGEANTTWPKLIEQDSDFDGFDVKGFGYQTSATGEATKLTSIVDTLEQHLTNAYKDYYRVVVVGHSMGGVVAALAIRSSFHEKDPGTVVNLITLATPFNGSHVADYLRSSLGPASSKHLDILTTISPVRELFFSRTWPRFRREQRADFRHYIGYEGRSFQGNIFELKIVGGESAAFGIRDGDPVHPQRFENLDHWQIAAPSSQDAKVYQKVKEWVFEADRVVVPRLPESDEETAFKTFRLAAGEHQVKRDIELPVSAVLNVEAGVTLNFAPGVKAVIEGVVIASGDADHPVIFDFNKDSDLASGLYLGGKGVSGSRFDNCVFRYGNGLEWRPSDPRTESSAWADAIGLADHQQQDDPKIRRNGGAVLINHGLNVQFTSCLFHENRAWRGGCVALFGSRGVTFEDCQFEQGRSGFGGSAVFVQISEVDFEKTTFHRNSTDAEYAEPNLSVSVSKRQYACGGALYMGYRSMVQATDCRFEENQAAYVGGAVYADNASPADEKGFRESIFANCQFVLNRCGGKKGKAGAAIWLDNETRVNLTSNHFDRNFSATPTGPGQAVMDHTTFAPPAGLKLNGTQTLIGYGMPPSEMSPAKYAISTPDDGFTHESLPPPENEPKEKEPPENETHPPDALRSLMQNPKSFELRPEQPLREIDSIVIHHVSAIFWNGSDFQSANAPQIREFERTLPGGPVTSDKKRKYDWRYCKQIFEIYGVSSHYMIDRDGKVIQLVRDSDIAYHAGKSKMPEPDGRESVNGFSIGIELISSHPDDDATVADGTTPAYTDAQYVALVSLTRQLVGKYDIPTKNIVGHEDIAPGRKKDPGPKFDWGRVRQRLINNNGAAKGRD